MKKKVFLIGLFIVIGYYTFAQEHLYSQFAFTNSKTKLILNGPVYFKNLGKGYYEIDIKNIPSISISLAFPIKLKYKKKIGDHYVYSGTKIDQTPFGAEAIISVDILSPCKMSDLCKGNWKHPKIDQYLPTSYFDKEYHINVIMKQVFMDEDNIISFAFTPLNFDINEIQEEISAKKLQAQIQENINRKVEIEKILSKIDTSNISSNITNWYNKKYFKEINSNNNELIPQKLKFDGDVNVWIQTDSSGSTNIVRIEEEIIHPQLNKLLNSSSLYCTLNETNYRKFSNYYQYPTDCFFWQQKVHIRTQTFEKGYGCLRNKGRKIKFYKNTPDRVKLACKKEFTKRGEYFFEYMIIDGNVTTKELNTLTQTEKNEIRGEESTGQKLLYIGGSILLLGILIVGA